MEEKRFFIMPLIPLKLYSLVPLQGTTLSIVFHNESVLCTIACSSLSAVKKTYAPTLHGGAIQNSVKDLPQTNQTVSCY